MNLRTSPETLAKLRSMPCKMIAWGMAFNKASRATTLEEATKAMDGLLLILDELGEVLIAIPELVEDFRAMQEQLARREGAVWVEHIPACGPMGPMSPKLVRLKM